MKRLTRLAACGSSLLLLIGVSGCPKPAPTGESKAKEVAPPKKADQFQQVLEILQAATETSGFREALNVAGSDLSRADSQAKIRLDEEARDFMRRRLELNDEELADVEARAFRPLDSFHLQHCILLREVARAIERSGAAPLEQVQQAMAWVDRHVLLVERVNDMVPSFWALQVGEGTARERALLFCAILDQMQITNCLVSLGESADGGPGHVFGGALIGDGSQRAIYLFDPRLGRPVPGAAGVCNFREFSNKPEAHLADPKGRTTKAPAVRVQFAVSMQALSPRMKYLEDRLAVHDRVTLFAAPQRLHKSLTEAAGQEVAPWLSSRDKAGRSPLRLLSAFLPFDEGGHDKTGRHVRAELRSFPWMDIQRRYTAMRIYEEVPPGQETLFRLTRLLFHRYDRDPRLALAGGHLDRAAKRLDWIREALEDADFAVLSESTLQKHADSFRKQATAAYLALIQKQPGGQALVSQLWNQDQYLGMLLQATERPDPKKEKSEITYLMLGAVRETLGERVLFLNALRWQDRAERSQAVLEASQKSTGPGKAPRARLAEKAASDWLNAQGAWQQYAERAQIATALGRLEQLQSIKANDLLTGQHQELAGIVHRAAAGRLFLATAQLGRNQLAQARNTLTALSTDLAKVRESGWHKDLADLLERIPDSQSLVRDMVKGVQSNLEPGGGIYWLQRRVDDMLAGASVKSN